MNKELTQFHNNKPMKDEVYGIIKAEIDKMSIDYIKSGKDASGFKEAYIVLDSAFHTIKKIATK